MSNTKTIDTLHLKSINRSKKILPPPLSLPDSNTITDEEKLVNFNQKHEQKHSTNNCCLSSSSRDCPHENISYILPIGQRSHILQTLVSSSSTLLVPPSSETRQRKSQTSINSNLKQQHQAPKQGMGTDDEWLDFIRLIVHKPLENELKNLLDKYKTTYFDRVNAPNTSDATIRASLCDMVSQTLATYSANSSLSTTSSQIVDNVPTNIPSSIVPNSTNNNSKRKRKITNTNISESSTGTINNQTKFLISYIIPGQNDNNTNSNKMLNQQRYKQLFHKKYSHLFKYIPDKSEQAYLTREGYLKHTSTSSTRSSNNQNNSICLMLYDEIFAYMDESDINLSGISIDDSFVLPELILKHIHSSMQ